MENYPFGMDYVWIACDSVGHVAVFITFGNGPISHKILLRRNEADQTEMKLRNLPQIGKHRLYFSYPDPKAIIAWANCGLFVYDWFSDEERYKIVAKPDTPTKVAQLPEHLVTLAQWVVFSELQFEQNESIYESELNEPIR